MSTDVSQPADWWGSFQVPRDRAGCWHVGPMTLWIQRLTCEWRVARTIDDHDDDLPASVTIPAEAGDLLGFEHVSRFGVSDASERVSLMPLLADRAVVTRPEKPFYIPAGQSVTIFVGSPLWLRIEAGDPSLFLAEMPIVRPSDTWFGPGNSSGELCYATRTACRLRLEELPVRPHRVISAVTVRNRSRAALLLARMKLPVQYLPLYRSDSGVLWTRDLTISHIDEDDVADDISYGDDAPERAGKARLVAQAREKVDANVAMRVFTSLFSR